MCVCVLKRRDEGGGRASEETSIERLTKRKMVIFRAPKIELKETAEVKLSDLELRIL